MGEIVNEMISDVAKTYVTQLKEKCTRKTKDGEMLFGCMKPGHSCGRRILMSLNSPWERIEKNLSSILTMCWILIHYGLEITTLSEAPAHLTKAHFDDDIGKCC